MPSYFADLVFTGERIEVCLKRGKFDYVSPAGTNNRRIGAVGAKRKEGDAHAVTSAPAWPKPQQTLHGTHQYAQHHLSFLARAGNSSNSAPVQPRTSAPSQQQCQSWHEFQHGKKPSDKEAFRVHPNPNVIWGPIAITNHQPVGSGDPWKDLPVSLPKVVEPQRDLRVSWGNSREFNRAMHGLQAQGPELDRGEMVDIPRRWAKCEDEPALQPWKIGCKCN